MIRSVMYKEVAVGRHYLTIGYDLKQLSIGMSINKFGADFYMYPFYIGFEYHGVDIDKAVTALIKRRLEENK